MEKFRVSRQQCHSARMSREMEANPEYLQEVVQVCYFNPGKLHFYNQDGALKCAIYNFYKSQEVGNTTSGLSLAVIYRLVHTFLFYRGKMDGGHAWCLGGLLEKILRLKRLTFQELDDLNLVVTGKKEEFKSGGGFTITRFGLYKLLSVVKFCPKTVLADIMNVQLWTEGENFNWTADNLLYTSLNFL